MHILTTCIPSVGRDACKKDLLVSFVLMSSKLTSKVVGEAFKVDFKVTFGQSLLFIYSLFICFATCMHTGLQSH